MARPSSLPPLIPLSTGVPAAPISGGGVPTVHADGAEWLPINDPRVLEIMAIGFGSASGISVSVERALKVPVVYRSVTLVAQSMGMLPLHLRHAKTKKKAVEHPLFRLLHRKPNDYQSAYEFRSLMQLRALVKGNAYALVIRGVRKKPIALLPLNPDFVAPKLENDWTVTYRYTPHNRPAQTFKGNEILHIRNTPDIGCNGLLGLSAVKQAADAIGTALAQNLAVGRLFQNGSFVPGVLQTDKRLDPAVARRLSDDWSSLFGGAANAGKTPLLEQGLKYQEISKSARDTQAIDLMKHQIEEVARIFGVPRPLLMMDDTTWGTGVDVLGQFFIRFGLNPWFDAWQQSIENTLLDDDEAEKYEVRFNAGVLERGNMAAQAEYFAKALGSGGHKPWMTQNDVREALDLPGIGPEGDSLEAANQSPPLGHNGGPPLREDE